MTTKPIATKPIVLVFNTEFAGKGKGISREGNKVNLTKDIEVSLTSFT